jgi:predicted DCC family thiol-disulfide oxidoreductase YuxK
MSQDSEIRILFDGDCPLCRREIAMLERLDRGRGRVAFSDITLPTFDAAAYGLTARAVHERIHGITAGGRVVEGVEVFRRAYSAVGLGWLLAPTRWPLIRPLAEAAYRVFARYRHRLTGRRLDCDADRCQSHPSRRPSH